MISVANLGGIFIIPDQGVPDVIARASVQIINMEGRRLWETDWDIHHLSSEVRGPSQFVYCQSCFENVHTTQSRDTAYANPGVIPRLDVIWTTKSISKCQL